MKTRVSVVYKTNWLDCAFCGRTLLDPGVTRMVAGMTANICNECVTQAVAGAWDAVVPGLPDEIRLRLIELLARDVVANNFEAGRYRLAKALGVEWHPRKHKKFCGIGKVFQGRVLCEANSTTKVNWLGKRIVRRTRCTGSVRRLGGWS